MSASTTPGRPAPGITLTPAVREDRGFLRDMLYEAACWRPTPTGGRPPREEVLADPRIARYLDGWGRPGDRGLIARLVVDGDAPERIGAAWTRLFPASEPGYGTIDEVTPELSIAVAAGWRGFGIGRALAAAVLAQAAVDGHERVSLSVEVDNPARRLYERLGFVVIRADGAAVTMMARLG